MIKAKNWVFSLLIVGSFVKSVVFTFKGRLFIQSDYVWKKNYQEIFFVIF